MLLRVVVFLVQGHPVIGLAGDHPFLAVGTGVYPAFQGHLPAVAAVKVATGIAAVTRFSCLSYTSKDLLSHQLATISATRASSGHPAGNGRAG